MQQLEALVKMVPTKEEESKLFNYKGDINELGSAEKFVRAMLSVPFAFQRVESLLYKETFDDEVVHLRNSFSMLEVPPLNQNLRHHLVLFFIFTMNHQFSS